MELAQILVVCTGNVCRSPLLEQLLRPALDERWGPGAVRVASAGTRGLEGSAMDERAASRLGTFGLDAEGFRARRLRPAMVAAADLVLTAGREHRSLVAQAHPRALRYAFTYLDFADLASTLGPEDLPETEDGPTWVREVTATLAARRGLRPPLSAEDATIIDPYRREDTVYDTMTTQVRRATPYVVGALTGRLPGAAGTAPAP